MTSDCHTDRVVLFDHPQAAMQQLLHTHQYGSATAWDVLSTLVSHAPKQLNGHEELLGGWLTQPGHPLVTVDEGPEVSEPHIEMSLLQRLGAAVDMLV